MGENDLSPEQRAARDELHDLLQRHVKVLGPYDEDGETPVPASVFLEEWCLVASWTDEDGDSWLTRVPSKKLQQHRREGLLHQGLYGF